MQCAAEEPVVKLVWLVYRKQFLRISHIRHKYWFRIVAMNKYDICFTSCYTFHVFACCVCMHVALCACMSRCVHACRAACMHVALRACMSRCVHACRAACMHVALRACMSRCVHACRAVCMHVALCACMSGCSIVSVYSVKMLNTWHNANIFKLS